MLTNHYPEIHLFIIWSNAKKYEDKIEKDINKNFNIIETIDISWDKRKFSKNLSRFYGLKLANNSSKEEECGNETFRLFIVHDSHPKYGWVETSRGSEYVNINMFYAKQRYRDITGGGHKIHATNSIQETSHDLMLLLGINILDYCNNKSKGINFKKWVEDHAASYPHKVINLKQNIIGENGWDNLTKFFYTINATSKYVVLRNFHYLPDNYVSEEHGDIDLLVDNLEEFVLISNARKIYKDPNRVHYSVCIAGEDIRFDFRFLNDKYYCYNWEKNILGCRELNKDGFYVPEVRNHFYSLIYHALIHKNKIAKDYYKTLKSLYSELTGQDEVPYTLSVFDGYAKILKKFMDENGYTFTRPIDSTVFYKKVYQKLDFIQDQLSHSFNIKSIIPVCLERYTDSGFSKFIGQIKNTDINVFIKWDGFANSAEKEYYALKILRSKKQSLFPKPMFYKNEESLKVFISEYVEAKTLEKVLLDNSIMNYDREKIISQLLDIMQILNNEKIIHRDIKPDNILIKENSDILLIDFQFSVSPHHKILKEHKKLQKRPNITKGLGLFNPKQNTWDDAFALLKVLEMIPHEDSIIYKDVHNKIKNNIGKLYAKNICVHYHKKILSLIMLIFVRNKKMRKKIRIWGDIKKLFFYINKN